MQTFTIRCKWKLKVFQVVCNTLWCELAIIMVFLVLDMTDL